MDKKAIGLVSDGPTGDWTNWQLDLQQIGPSGKGLSGSGPSGIGPNGIGPSGDKP